MNIFDSQYPERPHAKKLGYCDALMGVHWTDNPFRVHTPSWYAWMIGWRIGRRVL